MAGRSKTLKTTSPWAYTGRRGGYFNLRCDDCGFELKVSRTIKEIKDPCPACTAKKREKDS